MTKEYGCTGYSRKIRTTVTNIKPWRWKCTDVDIDFLRNRTGSDYIVKDISLYKRGENIRSTCIRIEDGWAYIRDEIL